MQDSKRDIATRDPRFCQTHLEDLSFIRTKTKDLREGFEEDLRLSSVNSY